jgi:hypothetical protein
MSEDFLLKRQWNDLFTAITEHDLDPGDFLQTLWSGEWAGFTTQSQVPTIMYRRNGDYLFAIEEFRPGQFTAATRPATYSKMRVHHPAYWDGIVEHFHRWLDAVKAEVESPNLWAELAARHLTGAVPATSNNSPFSQKEQRHLQEQIDRILAAVQLDQDQLTVVSADLDYLKEAASRSGRRDWALLVVGTLGSWALGSVLPPDKVGEIWTHFLPVLQTIGQVGSHLLRP